MRSRFAPFALLLVLGSLALPHLAQAAVPFFGPIIPQAGGQSVCAAGWGMFMIVINNLISFLITIVIVFIAPIMIAWSGFLMVANPFNPGAKEEAKGILTRTIVGIVIALSSWMIVDAVMAVLYNPTDAGATWSSLITTNGADICIPLVESLKQAVVSPGVTAVTGGVAQGFYQKNPSLLTKDQTGANWTQAEKDNLYTGTEAMKILESSNIAVNRGYSPVGQDCGTQCTSLNGIPKNTINTLVEAKKDCSTCSITVTGGTEGGHQSQGFGKASIDLRYDENTYSYLTGRGSQVVREAPLGSAVCGTTGWQCYAHVTAPHMSVYTTGGTVL